MFRYAPWWCRDYVKDSMDRDRNLLFGVFAVQLMQLTPTQLAKAAVAWAADPARDLSDQLVKAGALSARDRDRVAGFVERAVQAHHGDVAATLAAFGGEERIYDVFRGSIVLTQSGGVEPAPGAAMPWGHADSVAAVQESPGRYAQMAEYGRGGMGRILLVHDQHLRRDIALKELLPAEGPEGSSSQALPVSHVERFLQEARITGQLEHPSIVPVYELGHRRDGTLYYTMKLVRGKTLAEAVEEADSLEERLALLPHFADLCQAIAYAHSRGVIHRDIKPGNVMVGEFGETVVLDWGLAKSKNEQDVHADGLAKTLRVITDGDEEEVAKSAYGDALGTPAYMSPEQAEGKLDEMDERADVYSLGAVLYELLTGHAPFEGGTMYSALWRVMTEAPPPIHSLEPAAPPELAAICRRAMQRDRAARYESAKALADEVQRFESGALVHSYEYKLGDLFRRFIRKHKAMLATAAIAACVLLIGGVVSYLRVVHERDRAVAAHGKELQARLDEQRAREEEHRARQLVERESYSSSVLLAQKHAEDGFYDLALQALWRAPTNLRNWEWGYVLASCNQDLFTFTGHEDRVVDLAASPDGTLFVTASWDNTARVWDIQKGLEVVTLAGHEDGLTSVEFSPDAARIVTASFDGTARVWDARTGAELAVLTDHAGAVNCASFSPDGARIVTASPDKTAKVWDAKTGAVLATLTGHENNVGSACFSSRGTRILTASWRGTAKMWDASSYRMLTSLARPAVNCYEATFSPDGTRILTTFLDERDNTVRVWHARTGIGLFSLLGHSDRVLHTAFSPNGARIVTASSDKTAKVWDAQTGALIATLAGHEAAVVDVVFSPDGARVVTASRDRTAKVWDTDTGTLLGTLTGHDDWVVRATYTPDGARILTASSDKTAKLWDANVSSDGAPTLAGPSMSLFSAEFSADGTRLVTVSSAGSVELWDVETLAELASFVSFSDYSRAAISPDGKRVVTVFSEPGFSSNIWIWDVEEREILATLAGHTSSVNDVAFSPDGSRIVTASDDGTAKVWDAETETEQLDLVGHSMTVYRAAFSPGGGQIVTASSDDAARVWDANTGTEVATFPSDRWLDHVALSPDGSRLLTTTDDSGQIWNVETAEPLAALDGRVDGVSKAPFSPDGTRIVGVSSGKAKIWNAETGRELFALPDVSYAVFHPDGRRLLTVAKDNTGRLLTAAPFREGGLAGDAAMDWQTRFKLYKQHRLADTVSKPPTAHTPFDLIVATRDEVNKRLRQLVRISSSKPPTVGSRSGVTEKARGLSGQAGARPYLGTESEGREQGFFVAEGPSLAVLSRLCLRQDDCIVRINGIDIHDEQAGLKAFEAFLKDSESGSDIPLTIAVKRDERVREMRFRFLEQTVSRKEISFPRTTFAGLIWILIPRAKENPELLDEYDQRQAKWHREPIFDESPVGFWIDETYTPFVDNFVQQIGLQPGDRVTSIDATPIRSSRDLLRIAETLHTELTEGSRDACTIEVERGQFQRVILQLQF